MAQVRGQAGEDSGGVGRKAAVPLRLLLVEDDPGDALLARTTLAEAGVDAEWEHAGRLADVDFATAGDWADCVLVDLGLPDSHGVDAVRQVLHRAPGLPVVVISGNSDRELALAAVREGAQDYLVKGRIDPDLLAKTVRYAVERKRIELELRQAQQMARLGRLAGGLAHHFNNLLGIILNYAEFVAEALRGEAAHWEDTREDVARIAEAARRAADLTRQFTIFAEQDLAEAGIIELNEVIRAAQDALGARLGHRIGLELALAPDLPATRADRNHIVQVLALLADNARDAMPDGGRLVISTAVFDGDPGGGGAPGRYALVEVRDTGAGIPPGIIGDVFDPFFSTKPVGQGAGLGLAVVHSIMTRWGGQVQLRSTPAKGTTVTMLFPAAVGQRS